MSEYVVATLPVVAVTTDETEMEVEAVALLSEAETIDIATEADYKSAVELGRTIKDKTAQIKEFFAPMKKSAHDAHKAVCARENEALAPLRSAEAALKRAVSEYRQRVEQERRAAEIAARRAAMAEAEKQLTEAVVLEADGKQNEAAAAFRSAEIIDDIGRDLTVQSAQQKASGTIERRSWTITEVDTDKVPVMVGDTCIRDVNLSAVMKLIRASEGAIKIPGIKYEETINVSFRRQ